MAQSPLTDCGPDGDTVAGLAMQPSLSGRTDPPSGEPGQPLGSREVVLDWALGTSVDGAASREEPGLPRGIVIVSRDTIAVLTLSG